MASRRRQGLLLSVLAGWLSATGAVAATLQVTVHGVRNDHGHVRIGVCRKDEFLSEVCVHNVVVPAHTGDVSASIPNIAPGEYGIAVYQDEDDSGKLKRNFLGMPKEALGFSRDPSLRFGPPSFASSAITVGDSDGRTVVTLRHPGS